MFRRTASSLHLDQHEVVLGEAEAHLAAGNGKRLARLRVLRSGENLGLNRTLNRCLAGARGEYVARMDGDKYSAL